MYITTINKKEGIHLKRSNDNYLRGFGGNKGKGGMSYLNDKLKNKRSNKEIIK